MSVPFRHMLNSAEHSFFSHLKHVKNTDNTELNWSLAELTQIPEVTLQTGAPCHPCSIAQSCLRTGEEQPLPSLLLLQALQPYQDSCFFTSYALQP